MPRALVITAPGINCDRELLDAFSLVGAQAEPVLLNQLRRNPTMIDRYQLIGLPGGFSYGDDVAAGRIMGRLIRQDLYGALVEAIDRGVPMIAPCNGFQIAVAAGILPGPGKDEPWPESPAPATVTLSPNQEARFVDRWTRIHVPETSRCIWTSDLQADAETGVLPSAHGEGRFMTTPEQLGSLQDQGRIALTYGEGENFNGSLGAVAGICDKSGLVLGLMPHPERFTRWTQHPTWTRLDPGCMDSEPMGLQMFRRAFEVAVGAHVA